MGAVSKKNSRGSRSFIGGEKVHMNKSDNFTWTVCKSGHIVDGKNLYYKCFRPGGIIDYQRAGRMIMA